MANDDRWRLERIGAKVQHVYPTFGPAHVTDGDECWCNARVERVDGTDEYLVIHSEPAN